MRRSLAFCVACLPCLAVALSLSGCPREPFEGSPGGPVECQADSECDDKNPCTIDRCQTNVCILELKAAGVSCSDADLCNGDEACDGQGICAPGTPALDDGEMCTTDLCDPATGVVTHSAIAGCVPWTATPLEGAPEAREGHSAVWTGSVMIVWGGTVAGVPGKTATGGMYDPSSKVWTPTSMTGAPSPRHLHSAAWTGSKMIVWGGYGTSDYVTDGGAYDPATDTWTSIATAGAPSKRTLHADVWTGKELFIWGGVVNGSTVATGATYDPGANKWTATPAMGAPGQRQGHSAVWAGDRVIVWGGSNLFDWLNDGAMYKNGAWIGDTSTAGAPLFREAHTAVWTGSEMIVWGGFDGGTELNSGGIFDPSAPNASAWTATSTDGAPSAREEHTALWIDAAMAMMIWGGCGGEACAVTLGDGGLFAPSDAGGTWSPIAEHPALPARRGHAAVWTGTEVIVWGGRVGGKPTNTGAQAKLL